MQIDKSPTNVPGTTFVIAVAQPEDIPALQATAAACWWATYGDYLAASFIESFLARAYSHSRLLVQVTDPQNYFLVVKSRITDDANRGEALIGFGQVGPPLPRGDAATPAPADLHRLYLLPAWQRQGLGSQLLAALEAWLRQRDYPFYGAYVHERNIPAQRFYTSQGFLHKLEYDVEDEWYLIKPLEK